MTSQRRPIAGERGDSLVELLVAVTLLGLAVVAIVSGLGTSVLVSDVHRKQSTAGAEVRSFAEEIENTVAVGGYFPCADTARYVPAYGSSHTAPSNFTQTVTAVRYWNGSIWLSSCQSPDKGLQKLTLKISSSDNRASETLDVIIRKPCGPAPQAACT